MMKPSKAMLIVRFKYNLPLRELEGLFQFLAKLMNIPKLPSYIQVYRRMKSISLPEELTAKKNVTDLVLDTTGLKIYGQGEWCKKHYGGKTKWIKLHVAIDQKKQQVYLSRSNRRTPHNTACLEKALKRSNRRKEKF